ncbi:conserved hypothetical protein (plasmid) [Arthrobacter sp. Hiyo8]|nr:conserved hypothetical protein [Arthrobacter sp. Hiyo8]
MTRSYASAIADPAGPNGSGAANGPFGWGWTYNYGLTAATDGTTGKVTITQEDGSKVAFTLAGGVYTPTAPRFDATLSKAGTTYTYTRRGTAVFTFDTATGRLSSETDLAGTVATPAYATNLAYDGSGHLSTVTDPSGRTYTFTWTGAHITGVKDTANRQVSYVYDANSNLTDVYGVGTTFTGGTPNDADHAQYGYSSTHLITSMRTPVNYGKTGTPTPVTSMVYDTSERVTSQTDPLGRVTTFTYGPNTGRTSSRGRPLSPTPPATRPSTATTSTGSSPPKPREPGPPIPGPGPTPTIPSHWGSPRRLTPTGTPRPTPTMTTATGYPPPTPPGTRPLPSTTTPDTKPSPSRPPGSERPPVTPRPGFLHPSL